MSSTDLNCYLNGTPSCFQSQTFNELTSDTFQMSNAVQWNGAGQPQNFACNVNQAPLQTVQRYIVWYTDSLITRVGQKDLLHIYLTMANHPPKSAVPNRFDSTLPVGCNNPFTTASLAVAKSYDCGQTWDVTTAFDLNDPNFEGGAWAVPEYDANGNSNQKGYAIDRPEVFVDPYWPWPLKTSVFLTAAIRMGPQAGKTMVLKSLDGGKSWLDPVLLLGLNPNAGGNPTVLTTTPQHRVYAFRCEGTEPKLYWSDDYGESFKEKDVRTIKYADSNVGPLDCAVANFSDLASNVGAGSPSIGITRWGDPSVDNVIVTYPAVIDNVQVQPVMLVTTTSAGDEDPLITSNILIKGDQGRSVVQATLVPTDRFEFQPDEVNDPLYDGALLYWLEIPSAKGGNSTAKYMVVRRGFLWENKQQLALNNSVPDSWLWNVNVIPGKPSFIGDYNRGSFYVDSDDKREGKKRLHFGLDFAIGRGRRRSRYAASEANLNNRVAPRLDRRACASGSSTRKENRERAISGACEKRTCQRHLSSSRWQCRRGCRSVRTDRWQARDAI
jgi:hypothetical protein